MVNVLTIALAGRISSVRVQQSFGQHVFAGAEFARRTVKIIVMVVEMFVWFLMMVAVEGERQGGLPAEVDGLW